MEMKNKIMTLLLFLLAAVNMHAADGITVNFDVKNPVLDKVVFVYHMSVNEYTLTDGRLQCNSTVWMLSIPTYIMVRNSRWYISRKVII